MALIAVLVFVFGSMAIYAEESPSSPEVAPATGKLYAARSYLDCAALLYVMSLSTPEDRTALSKLQKEQANWFKIVGVALLVKGDESVGEHETFADAYIEAYQMEKLPRISDDDLRQEYKACQSPNLQKYGQQVISILDEKSR
jgi:hypothetical protein